jgi:cell division transport system permease protein
MALRVDYLAKETGNNLIRNPSLTIATVLTVAVSLALLGSALLIRSGVNGLNVRFQNDVEFIVWLDPEATDEQIQTVGDALDTSLAVEDARYITRQETYAEFQEFWADSPEIIDAVQPEQLPTSFRVIPTDPDIDVVEALAAEYQLLPGVTGVDFAGEFIKQLNGFTRSAATIMLFTAGGSLIASSLLMYNSIRTALFARRREVEVMRLVGASNSFIRIPFVVEGLVLGVIGAAFSVLGVFGLNRYITNSVENSDFALFDSFALEQSALVPIALTLILVGAVIGAIGSLFAVNRYLDA